MAFQIFWKSSWLVSKQGIFTGKESLSLQPLFPAGSVLSITYLCDCQSWMALQQAH